MAKTRLLIIDDEKDFTDTLSMRLEAKGYEIIEAYDGPTGLEKAQIAKPDLIVLDIMMPGMSGFDVCLKLKDDKELKAIPVIVLTAKYQPNDIQFAKELGADAYLTKPVEMETLTGKIHELLKAPGK